MNNLIFKISLLFMLLGQMLFAQSRPNILWINCDDLGAELACYGNPDVTTPNMDELAREGMRFTQAFSNATVCSASRSSQITGVYPSTINCQSHRPMEMYALPDGMKPITKLFREAGYFCSNGWATNMSRKGKEDYNFLTEYLYDGTDWAQRAEGQPFFAQVQINEPHRVFKPCEGDNINPDEVELPTCYFDHPIIRADWAEYLENIQNADKKVGAILKRLDDEGLAENTIVFLFGDHGRPHLRDKQWLYYAGMHVPLIVRFPNKIKAGKTNEELISLVDITASSLAIAGIEIPDYMHGQDVLGGDKRKYVYGFRGRTGDADDDIRCITDGRYRLIWNREPERPYMQLSSYKKAQYPAWSVYTVLYSKGELPMPYAQFMASSRPKFELYDIKKDPAEFNNIAGQKKYAKIQTELFNDLSKNLAVWEKGMVVESDELVQKAQASSGKYFKNLMRKANLPEDADEEILLDYWYKKFAIEK